MSNVFVYYTLPNDPASYRVNTFDSPLRIVIDGEEVWRRPAPALKVGDVVRIQGDPAPLPQDGKLGSVVAVIDPTHYRVSFGTELIFHVDHLQGEV